MPMPMPSSPDTAIMPTTGSVKRPAGLTQLNGNRISKTRPMAATPTRMLDAATGSAPVSITGRAIREPIDCDRAAASPRRIPTQSGPLILSHL